MQYKFIKILLVLAIFFTGLHVGAFALAWISGSMFLASILSPHWSEAVNSQSEAVASMRHTHGLLERCSYLPTGQIECYPIYDRSYQWAGAMKGLMFASFGLMVDRSVKNKKCKFTVY